MNKKNYTAETKGTITKSLLTSTETPRLTVSDTSAYLKASDDTQRNEIL